MLKLVDELGQIISTTRDALYEAGQIRGRAALNSQHMSKHDRDRLLAIASALQEAGSELKALLQEEVN